MDKLLALRFVVRSYLGYYAASHPHSAAKRQWARVVVGWVTSREVLVTYPFCPLTSRIISLRLSPWSQQPHTEISFRHFLSFYLHSTLRRVAPRPSFLPKLRIGLMLFREPSFRLPTGALQSSFAHNCVSHSFISSIYAQWTYSLGSTAA